MTAQPKLPLLLGLADHLVITIVRRLDDLPFDLATIVFPLRLCYA